MSADIVITVERLSKAYRLGHWEKHDTFLGSALSLLKSPVTNLRKLRQLNTFNMDAEDDPDILWALKDVSFEVRRGEVLGIIGRNGAGKSTLLKILSHIAEPTRGRVTIKGRVSALLEVGTGFHPELTGRENIYLNGTILGMRKAEIDRKFDEIVDFSGVERFIDTPVKRYSSGMQVRLAFAVAAHLEPEILIVDEVLAVGDAEFQKKCLGKMQDVAAGQGRTVLFVSHNMAAVSQLCGNTLLLESGRITAAGETAGIVARYLGLGGDTGPARVEFEADSGKASQYRSLAFFDQNGDCKNTFSCDEPVRMALTHEVKETVPDLYLAFHLQNTQGQIVLFSDMRDCQPDNAGTGWATGSHVFNIEIPGRLLAPGEYVVTLGSSSPMRGEIDRKQNCARFRLHELHAARGTRPGFCGTLLEWKREL